MSKQRQRALKHPRVIAWQEKVDRRDDRQINILGWFSEELPFNFRPIMFLVACRRDGFIWQAVYSPDCKTIIDSGGPCATLEEAKTAADTWYRFARSR